MSFSPMRTEDRFPKLGSLPGGWIVHDRGSRAARALGVYLIAPRGSRGRYWLTWLPQLGRFMLDSNLRRFTNRWPSSLGSVERGMRQLLGDRHAV